MLSLLAFVLTASLGAGSTGVASARSVPKSPQEVALLFSAHTARSAPTASATALEIVRALRPLTGERTALPVLARKTAVNGRMWLRVLLPGRPNGHAGWIKARATKPTLSPWRIVVKTVARKVTVYRSGRAVRTFRAVVGKPSTPTPYGRFFVEEAIQLRPGDVGAPFALALSARSTVLQEFAGGPGQIALHGLSNVGGVLGTAVSPGASGSTTTPCAGSSGVSALEFPSRSPAEQGRRPRSNRGPLSAIALILRYFGGGGTLQCAVVLLPDASVTVTIASPFSVIFQSITPGPGVTFGVAPGACTSLIFVPLA